MLSLSRFIGDSKTTPQFQKKAVGSSLELQVMDRQPCEPAGPALLQQTAVYSLPRRTEVEVKSVIIISQINAF